MLSSLRGRLLLSGMVTLILFVCITAWVLDKAFVTSVERSAEERLLVHVYSLLAAAESDEENLVLPRILEKSRFNRQNSGLYGYVMDNAGEWVWKSASAILLDSPALRPLPQGVTRFTSLKVGDEDYYAMGLGTYWDTGDKPSLYTFYVMESQAPHYATINGFRSTLWKWLLGLAIALLALIFLVMRWGLSPLQELKAQLRKMQSGENDRVEGRYPTEVQQVVDDLNTLLEYEQKQREKYKNSVSDLAHSLKTPLAVMRNAGTMDDPHLARIVDEQTQQMNIIVQQQLRRAISKGTALWSKGIEAKPVVERIAGALKKAYHDKQVQLDIIAEENAVFPGEEGSWYEIAGNLLDNAFKYGGQHIVVTLSDNRSSDGAFFRCIVEDDGPGIPAAEKEKVFLRGARLDSSVPGQGIGLAMVAELIHDLNGRIRLENSLSGGARFVVEIPTP